jgi:uncharacterized surface protein with fasciclin (FAS1) repeats
MKARVSQRLLSKTLVFALTAISILTSIPAFAKPCAQPKGATTNTNQGLVSSNTTTGNIVEIAAGNQNFKTLVAAVQAAGLVKTLSGNGPFTVFAPTDAAFAALPKGTLEKLLKPENKETLQRILAYHVVSGAIESKRLRTTQVDTIEGSAVSVQVKNGRIKVNNARVIQANIKASNGVIHVIDRVILPPGV